jgi:hypothetical protein
MSAYSEASSGGGEKGGYVLIIEWSQGRTAELEIEFEPVDCEKKALRLDISNTDAKASEKGEFEPLKADITLTDADGNKATLPLEEYAAVCPPVPVCQLKLQHVLGKPQYKALFRTVSIPVSDFAAEGPEALDAAEITGIEIEFKDGGGSASLDNIGFG